MTTIQPSKDYIFAEPTETVTQTASGIYLSKGGIEKPKTATIINVGDNVEWYKPNDVIYYRAYSSADISLGGKDYLLINQDDVLGREVINEWLPPLP